jgi:GH35 family endo-1,4-beta-xylanase
MPSVRGSFFCLPLIVACAAPGAGPCPVAPIAQAALAKPSACLEQPAAPVVLMGRELPLRSVGRQHGDAWILNENGYAGAFLTLPVAGRVVLTVSAAGHADQGAPPRLSISVSGVSTDADARDAVQDHVHAVDLPAGTHFVRVAMVGSPPGSHRELVLFSLRAEGARVLAIATDAFALAASDAIIAHGRRGHARVIVPAALPGEPVTVRLARHAFNFGVNVPTADNRYLPKHVEPGSDAERFQKFVVERFNTVVLSNAGQWLYHEAMRDRLTLEHLERFLAFAERHALRARLHTLLWDTAQQPAWVSSEDPKQPGLLTRSLRGDLAAKAELTQQINERIAYLLRDQARRYLEVDVINESVHQGRYLELYGTGGLADLFKRSAATVKAAGATTRLYLNEQNLLQWSKDPQTGAPDPYANWYRRHAERILAAGGPVDGLGIKYYPDGRDAQQVGSNAHSALAVFQVLQNLAVTGRRISLTEFAVSGKGATPERGAHILDETLRLVFGTPEADTFMLWAAWAGAAGEPPLPASMLVDQDFKPTPAGERFDALMRAWRTNVSHTLDAERSIELDGFYGDYEVTVGSRKFSFALTRGLREYTLLADDSRRSPL